MQQEGENIKTLRIRNRAGKQADALRVPAHPCNPTMRAAGCAACGALPRTPDTPLRLPVAPVAPVARSGMLNATEGRALCRPAVSPAGPALSCPTGPAGLALLSPPSARPSCPAAARASPVGRSWDYNWLCSCSRRFSAENVVGILPDANYKGHEPRNGSEPTPAQTKRVKGGCCQGHSLCGQRTALR